MLNEYDKSCIKEVLKSCVLRAPEGNPFQLSSGEISDTYIDIRLASFTKKGLWGITNWLIPLIMRNTVNFTSIAGVHLGGYPLATGVSSKMYKDTNVLYVRDKKKDHGTQKLIEGPYQPGDTAIIIDDVVTSGDSMIACIKILKEAGINVVMGASVLDREVGGKEKIEQYCPLISLITKTELLGK